MVAITRAILTLSFFLACSSSSIHAAAKTYTKADLEILKNGKNYFEFFKHAKDIVPTQRDNSWLEMVSSMASEMVDFYRGQERYQRKNFESIEKLAQWPELVNDEFFQVKRNSYSIIYFKRCLLSEQKQTCYQEMKSFWKTARQDPETGYQLLVLAEGFFPHKNSWSFIKKSVQGPFSKFYCQKDIVIHTLEKRLRRLSEQDYAAPTPSSHLKDKLKLLAAEQCWQKAAQGLAPRLLEGKAKNQAVIFFTLQSLGLLEKQLKYTYLSKYFLESPTPGPLLNLAWSALEKLSQDYDLRKKVLINFKEFDPLPGDIFSLEEKNQVFTKHLVKNFPEYVGHYTKTCVSYLSGKKVFPYGNPTVNCHQLFKMNEREVVGERIISQPLRIKYSGLMKNSLP